jgi:hypothetical protein
MDDMKLRRPLGDLTMNKQDRLKLVLQRKLEYRALRLAETTHLERRFRPSRPPNSATKRRCQCAKGTHLNAASSFAPYVPEPCLTPAASAAN